MDLSSVKDNLLKVKGALPEGVKLVAVSKFHPSEYIQEAYNAGQRIFGESHEQELKTKHEALPKDIEWHFIGHLQTNKVRYIVPYITMIESIDSFKLLSEINKQAAKCNRNIKVLLELHVAQEETKYGLKPQECLDILEDGQWRELNHVTICGLMMMASNVDDTKQIADEFDTAYGLFEKIKTTYFNGDDNFCVRSWGMSHDYDIAVNHGSNMIRVGTAIFGPRVY